jgi:outer membrane lipoprotein-sorting protein
MRRLLFIVALSAWLPATTFAQDANAILNRVRSQFEKVNDLRCDVQMNFDIPGVAIDRISGKMLYKKPDKFRVKTKGLIFLPKQNPFSQLEILEDPTKYMAVAAGSASSVKGVDCHVINVIPTDGGELVLMKLLIGKKDNRIYESELTLKREGTVQYFNTYASATDFIPTTMEFKADFKRFKMPKAISGDFNSTPVREEEGQSKYETGRVLMTISNVVLNQKIDDAEFLKEDS